jgi:transposase
MSKERQGELFEPDPELPGAPSPSAAASAPGVARVVRPNRTQLELRPCDLESLLPDGHRARLVWAWVERSDLSAIYAGIRAVQGGSGRSAIAPEIRFALWLYATLEGVGSARAIA